MANERSEMGAFLRSRRARLTPSQAGIDPFPGPRRVPGLRREELAVLAGLSPDYYRRLEQGRQANVSDQVLDALARALRLDPVEQAHLRDLAGPPPSGPVRVSEAPQRPDPGLLRVMATLDHVPALLLGRRGEVLAHNRLLAAVLGRPLEPGSPFSRYLFQDPLARERIVNWADFASGAVAALRREVGRRPHDGKLHALIAELRDDPQVARWWEDHGVCDYASAPKQIDHPAAGRMSFGIEVLGAPQEAEQRLIVYTVEPDSPTARILPMLASWEDSAADVGAAVTG